MEKAAQSSNQVAESESSNDNKKREGDLEKSNLGIAKKQRTETTSTVENKVIEEEKQKKTSEIEADGAEDKGSRHTMEDAWIVLSDASLESPGTLRCAHFAIYDGHGGRLAAEYAQKHLHKNVVSAGLPRELLDVKAAKKAILDGFRKTDESLLRESTAGGWQDGATAVCVWILEDTVFIANIGDAKAVLARSSEVGGSGSQNHSNETSPLKALVLTREHKAIYPVERARIQKAGGSISANGRLQGRLEVSRALGDRQFKKVGVIATPDIHSFDLTDREHFIILGCDGLWGVFGPSDAVEFVQRLLKEGLTVKSVSRRLVREAVIERRCKDNCTAIVIVFRH
ncbi:probable protein phosphatase 2C 8 isoform X2 [Ricinus communis]|uniref:probable protein phosphatase 2C 8 isoform X2 n=1 Tax=Ricinus communis TaxID=3988 RepID=UPI000772CEFD|nr:probable protein phosphatase 2C 8 isoform X2 [Ricinus communis]|eukprot:XP_015575426.1 probable protein phosphatase 2C 8 isoform X2 [Ricinus communis]